MQSTVGGLLFDDGVWLLSEGGGELLPLLPLPPLLLLLPPPLLLLLCFFANTRLTLEETKAAADKDDTRVNTRNIEIIVLADFLSLSAKL